METVLIQFSFFDTTYFGVLGSTTTLTDELRHAMTTEHKLVKSISDDDD